MVGLAMTATVHDFRQGRTYSPVEFEALVGSAAATLSQSLPANSGARVAVLSRNGIEMLALFAACFRVGAIFVPLNWRLSRREVGEVLVDCGAALLFVQEEFRALIGDFDKPVMALDAGFSSAPLPAPPPGPDSQIAMLLYTSGTTGRSKGVILTLGNLRAASENFRSVADVRKDSGLLCDAPMFHTIGLVAICHTTLVVGCRVLLSPAFVAEDTVDRIGDPRLGITHYFTVPQVAQLLLQAPNFAPQKFSRLRALFTGGAPLAPQLVDTWRSHGVTVINGYGSSEAGTSIHMPLDEPAMHVGKPGSIGKPVALLEVSLRDRDGNVVPSGEVGEIWLRGPSLTSGYWGLEAETRKSFSGDWFRTGDAARCDADGFYTIVDRWKDMYISGGENVYPAEAEQVLSRLPEVAEVAVVGQPDPQWGEIGEAFIVLKPGATLDAEQVIRHVRANLATYKCPRRVQFLEALPRTASGKVMKTALRSR